MRCASVEKLMPLYAEGDLSERETSEVRSHLSSCDGCSLLSEEFSASQRRLRNFAAPEFGEQFYQSIRGAVLSEIAAASSTRPSVFSIFRQFLMARPALASSFALFVVFALAGGYLYSRLSVREPERMAAVENSLREIKTKEYAEATRTTSGGPLMARSAGEEGARKSSSVSGPGSRQKIGSTNKSLAPSQGAVARSNDTMPGWPAQAMSNGNNGAASDGVPATEVVARMEIQTSDPNIRIIWLGRKSGE